MKDSLNKAWQAAAKRHGGKKRVAPTPKPKQKGTSFSLRDGLRINGWSVGGGIGKSGGNLTLKKKY